MHQATLRIKLPFFLLPLLTLAFSGCISPVPHYRPPAKAVVLKKLPKEPFWWGTSTASFQNEDRGCAPGSKWYYRTDWDCFADEGGRHHAVTKVFFPGANSTRIWPPSGNWE